MRVPPTVPHPRSPTPMARTSRMVRDYLRNQEDGKDATLQTGAQLHTITP